MTTRPILFNGPMVRAILDGRKTQTRRVIKQAINVYGNYVEVAGEVLPARETGWVAWFPGRNIANLPEFTKQQYAEGFGCPYGTPGDHLWVRETWMPALSGGVAYHRADMPAEANADGVGWRASIHMPRWASRLTLAITDVRVQRLQDITTREIEAEGVLPDERYLGCANRYRHAFSALWDGIYARRGYGWEANPWVWVITFTASGL